jgi:hypothetical protein
LLAALVAMLLWTDGGDAVLSDPGGDFGLLLALVAVGIPATILLLRRWGASNRELAGGLAVFALLLVVIGYPLQRHYLHDRFGPDSGLPGQEMSSAYLWARGIRDARIGIAGTTAGFYQYGLYGLTSPMTSPTSAKRGRMPPSIRSRIAKGSARQSMTPSSTTWPPRRFSTS